jgi:hypothetical protein
MGRRCCAWARPLDDPRRALQGVVRAGPFTEIEIELQASGRLTCRVALTGTQAS